MKFIYRLKAWFRRLFHLPPKNRMKIPYSKSRYEQGELDLWYYL